MWQNIYRRGILIILCSTLVTACSKDENVNVAPPTPTPAATSTAMTSPTPKPKIAKSQPAKTPNTPIPDTFEEATDIAIGAVTISQSTVSREDWKLVANRWQEAINLMKKVPEASKNYQTAQAKIPEYQNKWEDAKKKAQPVVKIDPEQLETNPSFFSIPIKGKHGGIPIVEIYFNGRIFDMLFDTGATNTLITLSAAASLDLKPVGATIVTVADGSRVLLPIAELKSIEADGRIKKKFKVSVAPPSMPIGLLGHDFFEGYDINIKRDVIEFNRRSGN